jgi:hypothetical protein
MAHALMEVLPVDIVVKPVLQLVHWLTPEVDE